MYTFLLSEFIRLSKFELERELDGQTTYQSKVVTLVFGLYPGLQNNVINFKKLTNHSRLFSPKSNVIGKFLRIIPTERVTRCVICCVTN